MKFKNLSQLEKELITCRDCPRLVAWREEVGAVKRKAYRDQVYWSKPVPGFGDAGARVLVLGLAPGAHGSNRTGRMFTGDDSGKFLYPALYRAGFSNQPDGFNVGDGLLMKGLWITAVCRCVPPDNKPTRDEIINCQHWLDAEIEMLHNLKVVVALGKLAWDQLAVKYGVSDGKIIPAFSHGGSYYSDKKGVWVVASYHPSRQNTQTGRLTAAMFDQIWMQVNQLLVG
ncbi:MAG: uracil-DNA glycosylase [Chloroflexi bacterium HGW-Chloroflexi-5]|jgi:uracil-DNA glycosylase family 4|nr:MAG: uracil-DNA glycosylase [Chloroflexi bacterium HGW-Chloroflexi-5]